MRLQDFKVEKWLNPLDPTCTYNLGASCVKAFTVQELLDLIGYDTPTFLEQVRTMALHYGSFEGLPRLRQAIGGLFRRMAPENVLTVHGGTGANHMVLAGLLDRGDAMVAVKPNYQQHYEIPASLGAEVRVLPLREEDEYVLDMEALDRLVDCRTKLIALSNPNNPTGVFLEEGALKDVVRIADRVGAHVLCDEIYRGLDDAYMPSVVDLYERGISTGSLSKVFSMAGTRLGWIVTPDRSALEILENRRSYDTICCGVLDELLAALALEHHEKILARSRRIVRKNRAILDEWLKTQPHLSSRGVSRSSTCLIRYDVDIPSEALCRAILDETGVLLCHGDCFVVPSTFRLGYSFDEGETLTKGLQALGDFFSRKDRTGW